jgi:hypothetical protein
MSIALRIEDKEKREREECHAVGRYVNLWESTINSAGFGTGNKFFETEILILIHRMNEAAKGFKNAYPAAMARCLKVVLKGTKTAMRLISLTISPQSIMKSTLPRQNGSIPPCT